MGIERFTQVIDHPEDRLPDLRLAKEIAFTGMTHLVDRETTCLDEGTEEVEVVGTTGFNHRHRRNHQVDLMANDIARRSEGLEGMAEKRGESHFLCVFVFQLNKLNFNF